MFEVDSGLHLLAPGCQDPGDPPHASTQSARHTPALQRCLAIVIGQTQQRTQDLIAASGATITRLTGTHPAPQCSQTHSIERADR